MKKNLLFIIFLICSFSAAFAQSGTTGNLTWKIANNTLTISGTGAMPNYSRNAYYVCSSPWFKYYSSIKKVDIKEGVTSIGYYAFYESYLTSITIPSSVTSIGYCAFSGCSLTDITIPNGVTRIDQEAFYGCRNLTSITVPNGVTRIEKNVFSYCSSLTSIIIPSSVTSINPSAFMSCHSLNSMTLPFVGLTATSTGEEALLGALFDIYPGGDSKAVIQYYQEGKSKTYYMPKNLEKLTITSPAARLEYGALYNCSQIKELTISSSVTGVAEKALYGCSGLEHIYAQRALPPAAYGNSFEGVGLFSCMLHIPTDSKKFYEKATGWKDFFIIQEEAPIKITATAIPLNGGMIVGYGEYERNMPASLEAIAHSEYTFKCWMESESVVSPSSVYSFTAIDSRNLYAVFIPKENADESIVITPQPTSAAIVWNVVEGAETYTLVIYSDEAKTQELYRVNLDVNGNVTVCSTEAQLNHIIPNLTPSTPYYYTLTSYNDNKQALSISGGDFATVATGSSIEEESQNRINIRLYPNPVRKNAILSVSGIDGQAVVAIHNMTGKKIYSERLPDVSESYPHFIDVTGYSTGVYILNVYSKNNVSTLKMIVK